jgi:hypothetical protein
MNLMALRFFLVIALTTLAICPPAVFAHKVTAVSVVTELDTKAQTYQVELAMEVDPTGDPAIDDVITPEQAAITFATEALVIYFDDEAIEAGTPEVRIITESDEDTPVELRQQKAVATLKGGIPKGAGIFMLYVDETTEAAVVMVVIKDEKPGRRLQVLYPGEFSNPENVEPVIEADPFPTKQVEEQEGQESGPGGLQRQPESNPAQPLVPWIPIVAALLGISAWGIIWKIKKRG